MDYAILILAVILGLIPGWIASRKGRRFWPWWLFGSLLWIVAIVVVLVVSDQRSRCPSCREVIQPGASRCPHCQSELFLLDAVTPRA